MDFFWVKRKKHEVWSQIERDPLAGRFVLVHSVDDDLATHPAGQWNYSSNVCGQRGMPSKKRGSSLYNRAVEVGDVLCQMT